MKTESQNFRSPNFLRSHMRGVMDFYHRNAMDVSGGMHEVVFSDGTREEGGPRHLVSAARYVVAYAMLYRVTGEPEYRKGLEHSVDFLRRAFFDPHSGSYAWTVEWKDGRAYPRDATRHAYGMAFVVLAFAHAAMCRVGNAAQWLGDASREMEKLFWEPHAGLYADEKSLDGTLSPYRGQNANMHACEAMIAAYRATGDLDYLYRAETIARSVSELAAPNAGLIWEHYHADWSIDWQYNREARGNKYRPWGYQPGHFTEWAKLLLLLDRDLPAAWHLQRAVELFDAAAKAWDTDHGGFHYALAPDGQVSDAGKYHWVQAESFAAAALLAQRTGHSKYWDWYDRIWSYCWTRFVDHGNQVWSCLARPAGEDHAAPRQRVSAAGYHNIGACNDALGGMAAS